MKTEPPPGTLRPPALQKALDASYAAQPADYVPRTHLLQDGHARFVNRLINEPSPYLRQHAHNPVDWWPWGEDALAEAARLDRPIFLSAGYSTCHWCHVMEEESFDREDVAALLNQHFIAVKLDREQRPDIDHLYILATSLQHRQAGWPNSVWLLPDGRPFHTGTYFQRPHFIQLLQAIAAAWAGDGRAELERFGANLAEGVARVGAQSAAAVPLDGAAAVAQGQLAQSFNDVEGGFSTGTQFPHEGYLLFLLDRWRRSGDAEALRMAETSLAAMAAGGLQDHVGGGFHRYTVDVNWRTPHFEKMLYNQALLLRCYTEAHEITARPDFARAAARLVDYLLRDMTAGDGAFFSAEDADSLDPEGKLEEGAFYVWTPEAARGALGDDAEYAIQTLGLAEQPTLEAGPVAHLKPGDAPDFTTLDPLLERLRLARDARTRPLRDDKIIGGWNGLMIRALAEAGMHFDRPDWTQAAERAANAVFARLKGADGLARMHAAGKRVEAANLTDHVWLAQAALALSDALGNADWTDRAAAMTDEFLERFGTADGRLALVREGTPLGPVLEAEDGAVPSGEASALELLAHLDTRRPDPRRHARAEALMAALSGTLAAMPVVRLQALLAAETLRDGETGFARASEGVQIRLLREAKGWALRLIIADGWHIAAGGAGLSAPILTGAEVNWPEAQDWPSPLGAALPAYLGSVTLPLRTPEPRISLTLQPCSETLCLAPITFTFQVPR